MNPKVDKPCTCGHPKSMHKEHYDFGGDVPACMVSNGSDVWHECKFTLDNLAYLLLQYERTR